VQAKETELAKEEQNWIAGSAKSIHPHSRHLNGVGALIAPEVAATLPMWLQLRWQMLWKALEKILIKKGTYYWLRRAGSDKYLMIILKRYSTAERCCPVQYVKIMWTEATETVHGLSLLCAEAACVPATNMRLVLVERPDRCRDLLADEDQQAKLGDLMPLPFGTVLCIQRKNEPLAAFPLLCEEWFAAPYKIGSCTGVDEGSASSSGMAS
jgi:hypothetical protein